MSRSHLTSLSRRTLLGGGVATLAVGWSQTTNRPYAYVGCYTTAKRNARGDGIHVYRVDPEKGTWLQVQQLGGLVNPSFLITSRDQRFLYAAHGDETYASSFKIDPSSGQLTNLNRASTGGTNVVHLALNSNGRYLVVANYTSGSVAALPVREDGSLGDAVDVVTLAGQAGPHKVEQTSSHPHHIVFDASGRFVVVPDKGLDRIFVFELNPNSGKLKPSEQGSVVTRAGSGPRHAAFHPSLPVLWVLNELNSTVTTYDWDARQASLRAKQILSTLPADFTGENTAAEITTSHDGRYVYCSNRGHDSIAMFSVGPSTGLLTSNGWTPSGGKVPRYIGFDPTQRFLYSANEQSDVVTMFRVNTRSGRLTSSAEPVRNASPVTIAFATLQS